jgi:hypothetical protein
MMNAKRSGVVAWSARHPEAQLEPARARTARTEIPAIRSPPRIAFRL